MALTYAITSCFATGRLSMDSELPVSFALALRLCVAGTFAWSAINKVLSPNRFVDAVRRYHLLPHGQGVERGVAYAIVALETVTAVGLVIPDLVLAGCLTGLLLTVIFSAAVITNLMRGRQIPCGCFGDDPTPISAITVVRLLLIAVALGVLLALLPWGRGYPDDAEQLLESILVAIALTVAGSWVGRSMSMASVLEAHMAPPGGRS
jgi:hypothetical protein